MADNFDIDENGNSETPQPPPAPSSNRTFVILIAALGGLFLLAVIILVIYVAVILPKAKIARDNAIAQINTQNAATVAALTEEAKNRPTATATRVPSTATPTSTVKPSATAVVALPSKTAPSLAEQIDPRTATVSALLTQAAAAQLTATFSTTGTPGLPKTGFAEDVGIPGLVGVTILLLVVIFLVRRMRTSTTS